MTESPAERFDRDWNHVRDDRKDRTLDHQSEERLERKYVDRETRESAALESVPADTVHGSAYAYELRDAAEEGEGSSTTAITASQA